MTFKTTAALVSLAGVITLLSACDQAGTGTAGQAMKNEGKLFQLAHMNGCVECHTVSASTVGPSWQAIADRYKDAPRDEARAHLIESIKKGSKGQWFTWKGGNGMDPLERRVSAEHIAQLVDYILSIEPSK